MAKTFVNQTAISAPAQLLYDVYSGSLIVWPDGGYGGQQILSTPGWAEGSYMVMESPAAPPAGTYNVWGTWITHGRPQQFGHGTSTGGWAGWTPVSLDAPVAAFTEGGMPFQLLGQVVCTGSNKIRLGVTWPSDAAGYGCIDAFAYELVPAAPAQSPVLLMV